MRSTLQIIASIVVVLRHCVMRTFVRLVSIPMSDVKLTHRWFVCCCNCRMLSHGHPTADCRRPSPDAARRSHSRHRSRSPQADGRRSSSSTGGSASRHHQHQHQHRSATSFPGHKPPASSDVDPDGCCGSGFGSGLASLFAGKTPVAPPPLLPPDLAIASLLAGAGQPSIFPPLPLLTSPDLRRPQFAPTTMPSADQSAAAAAAAVAAAAAAADPLSALRLHGAASSGSFLGPLAAIAAADSQLNAADSLRPPPTMPLLPPSHPLSLLFPTGPLGAYRPPAPPPGLSRLSSPLAQLAELKSPAAGRPLSPLPSSSSTLLLSAHKQRHSTGRGPADCGPTAGDIRLNGFSSAMMNGHMKLPPPLL
jgi:hypothetical protein